MTDREILEKILNNQEYMQKQLEGVHTRLDSFETRQKSIRYDVIYIKKQIDTIYDWVDGIDLKVKNLEKVI